MSALQTFRLFNALGQPLVGASPSLVYVDGTGAPVAPPSIFPIGVLGKYGFLYDDIDVVRVFRVDGGINAVPRYLVGGNGGDVQVFGTYNVLGAPTNPGVGPSFVQYVDQGNAPLAQPSFVNPATGLFFFLPSPSDIVMGVSYVVDADGLNVLLPDSYDGTIGDTSGGGGAGLPTVSNFAPALAAAVRATDTISFDVTDALTPLQRVVVLVSFPNLNIYEVAHDGDAQGPRYANQFCSRVPIVDGWRYTLLRDAGWPGSVRIIPMAFDNGGGVNPISSVIYGWTLVE